MGNPWVASALVGDAPLGPIQAIVRLVARYLAPFVGAPEVWPLAGRREVPESVASVTTIRSRSKQADTAHGPTDGQPLDPARYPVGKANRRDLLAVCPGP